MSQRTSSRPPRLLLATWLLALGGCFDDCDGGHHDPLPGPGELGRGDFHYRCIGDGDPACGGGTTVASFPSRVAVGARFELDYTWNDGDDQPQPTLRSGAPERLHLQGETFTAIAYGYTAVLAVLPDSSIGDLIHIRTSEPLSLSLLHEHTEYSDYTLAPGDEPRFHVIPRDEDGYDLAGLLQYTFAVDDPSIAEIVGTGAAHVIVRAHGEGTTTLRASLGDLRAELTLTVESTAPLTTDSTGDTTDSTGDSTDSTGDTGDTGDSTGDSTTDTTGGAL